MAAVIEAEGASFIPGNTELAFAPADIETLLQVEIDAVAMLVPSEEEVEQAARAIQPKWGIYLRGELMRDVIVAGQNLDGSKFIERYARDENGNLKSHNGEFVSETITDDFEFREYVS